MQSVPIRPYNLTGVAIMNTLNTAVSRVAESLDQVAQLNARYRAGEVHAYVPEALRESERSLEKLIEKHLPASHAALEAASRALFFSLPVAFNPAESVGPYLAVIARDPAGQPYRFLDMGALVAGPWCRSENQHWPQYHAAHGGSRHRLGIKPRQGD